MFRFLILSKMSMESGTDKRSRESPDSTLKPEGKSLKTSETTTVQTTTDTDEMSTADSVKPSNVTKRPKTVSEVKSLMQEVHSRMPAWKAEKILETRKADQVDLAALGEATGILFESQDMLKEAVLHLDRIRKKKTNEEDADLDASGTSDTHSSESKNQDEGENTRSDDQKEKSAKLHLLGMRQQLLAQLVTVKALATKGRSHPLRHQLTPVNSKMMQHPNQAQLMKRSRNLRLNLMKIGLIVSLKGDRMCYCLQSAQAGVRRS